MRMRTAAATVAALAAVLTPAQAHAGQPWGCYGAPITTFPVTDASGTVRGDLGVYAAPDGTKCAVLAAADPGTGHGEYFVAMAVCAETRPGTACTQVEYTHRWTYANYGDTAPLPAAGHCVRVWGYLALGDGTYAEGIGDPPVNACD